MKRVAGGSDRPVQSICATGRHRRKISAFAVTVVLLLAAATNVCAQQSFPTPDAGVTALLDAVANDDDAALLDILGEGADDLVYSGDEVADLNGRARFLRAYEARHALIGETPERYILRVGTGNYHFPIPLVRREDRWLFHTIEGRLEILSRRIGRNELHTIEVMEGFTEAQREYANRKPDGERGFARRFTSSPGKRDGLYWETVAGEEESPLGPLMARATEEGYALWGDDSPEPFHGYLFRILTRQGAHAAGGAYDYLVDGRMVLGFALVAYPARYGISGIMTFQVNQAGVVYEKDLGDSTQAVAEALQSYDPDASWREVTEPAGE